MVIGEGSSFRCELCFEEYESFEDAFLCEKKCFRRNKHGREITDI
jgi:hypothetical protein